MANKDKVLREVSSELDRLARQLAELSDGDCEAEETGTPIVLAISDELYGNAIARFVVRHEWQQKPSFYLIHAIEPLPSVFTVAPMAPDDLQDIFDQQQQFGNRLLNSIEAKIKNQMPDVAIQKHVELGAAEDEILAAAKNMKAQFIVMGTHGLTGLKRFALGSVSQAVVSHAPCSTVIIRVPEAERKAFEACEFDLTEEDLPQSMGSYAPAERTPGAQR